MTGPQICAHGRLTMSLHIEQRESEGVIILDLKGPLTLGHGDLELRDQLPALHRMRQRNYRVDRAAVGPTGS